jgi:hypothetical protein
MYLPSIPSGAAEIYGPARIPVSEPVSLSVPPVGADQTQTSTPTGPVAAVVHLAAGAASSSGGAALQREGVSGLWETFKENAAAACNLFESMRADDWEAMRRLAVEQHSQTNSRELRELQAERDRLEVQTAYVRQRACLADHDLIASPDLLRQLSLSEPSAGPAYDQSLRTEAGLAPDGKRSGKLRNDPNYNAVIDERRSPREGSGSESGSLAHRGENKYQAANTGDRPYHTAFVGEAAASKKESDMRARRHWLERCDAART